MASNADAITGVVELIRALLADPETAHLARVVLADLLDATPELAALPTMGDVLEALDLDGEGLCPAVRAL